MYRILAFLDENYIQLDTYLNDIYDGDFQKILTISKLTWNNFEKNKLCVNIKVIGNKI